MRFFVDVLTGVPSIVFGLFIYIVLIVGTGSSYAGYKGSFALVAADAAGRDPLGRGDPAAGARRAARVGARARRAALEGDLRVVLPTALPGMVTGVLLAIARAAGETAPLLFTAAATHNTNFNLGQFMNSLPVQIYNDVTSPTTAVVNRAWGAALTLVVMILLLNLIARLVSRRSRLA